MANLSYSQPSVNVHDFAMIPRPDIPRSRFRIQTSHKTAINAGLLYPFYVDEVLPGDTFNMRATVFGRISTPIFPVMDNLYLETFFFFVPNRLVWKNWVKMMGQQDNPSDSISYVVPTVTGVHNYNTLGDFFGLPTAQSIVSNALPFRAYNLIFNEWFRDQNLVSSVPVNRDSDGPDNLADYVLRRRGKRHDYFTSALPWVQKFAATPLPLGVSAPVVGIGAPSFTTASGTRWLAHAGGDDIWRAGGVTAAGTATWATPNLVADLSAATAATINQLRQAFQVQKLLERDARGGTRYTELVRSHFGVTSPDARLQRPEYIGGGRSVVQFEAIPQTSQTDATPQGRLSAAGTVLGSDHGFHYSSTEHGYIIGLLNIRADMSYQQGQRRLWSRSTRFDFYFPVFANLGEQAILNREIYYQNSAADNQVFGYQERWAEYRYHPAYVTGLMRSTSPLPLDAWHLAQRFTSLPTLNETFIGEDPPVARVVAVPSQAHFLIDAFFDCSVARPMPMYSVPGLVDHF